MKTKHSKCQNCQMIRINGVLCHETGCPTSYIGTERECKWCGGTFEPQSQSQQFCCQDCGESYNS